MAEHHATNEETVELVLTRTFDAPRELLFHVWSDPEHLKHWWGPKGFTMGVATLDFRPGGIFHYSMQSPEGQTMWGKFVYHEIEAPEKIVFVNSFSDEAGNVLRHPASPTWPLEVMNTLTFTEQDGKTTLTMRGVPVSPTEAELQTFLGARDMVQQGFAGTFKQLDDYLATL